MVNSQCLEGCCEIPLSLIAVAEGCCSCVPPRPLHSLSSRPPHHGLLLPVLLWDWVNTLGISNVFWTFLQTSFNSFLSNTCPLVQCVLFLKQWVYGSCTFSKLVHLCPLPMIASAASHIVLTSQRFLLLIWVSLLPELILLLPKHLLKVTSGCYPFVAVYTVCFFSLEMSNLMWLLLFGL